MKNNDSFVQSLIQDTLNSIHRLFLYTGSQNSLAISTKQALNAEPQPDGQALSAFLVGLGFDEPWVMDGDE